MTVAAVICEYNPFHNGHKYQLDTIRKKLHADYIICLMSGDFVERGEPALYSKEIRARMALENGADLCLLLPIPYATGSADLFAHGAVTLLNKLNVVDYLCFGSECGDIDALCHCAGKLLDEGQVTAEPIKALMKEGNTFAKSRQLLFPEYDKLLSHSNNVLALEYIMALKRTGSSIKPYTVKREGEDYDDANYDENSKFLSATAIRNAIFSNEQEIISSYVPYDLNEVNQKPISLNSFSDELFYSLLLNKDCLSAFLESSEDLTNRILNSLSGFKNATSFIDHLKTKNLTYSRVSRTMLHILLNIRGDNTAYKEAVNGISHIKVLGFRKESSVLFPTISEKSDIDLITSIPQTFKAFNDITKKMFDAELFASTLYNQKAKVRIHEYQKQVIVI